MSEWKGIYADVAGSVAVGGRKMSKDELKRIVLELLNDEDVIAALYAPLTGAADAGREYSSGPDAIVSGVRNEPQKIHLTLNADGIFDLLNDDAKGGDDEGES